MTKAIAKKGDVFKESAIVYLKSLDDFGLFQEKYNAFIKIAYYKLIKDAEDIDYKLEKEFIRLNAENNNTKIKKIEAFKEKIRVMNERFDNHRQMLEGMKIWNLLENPKGERLIAFKNKNINKVYIMYKNQQSQDKIVNFIEYYYDTPNP